MRKLRLSFAAAEDLENILQYTLDIWGENQFEKYLSLFQTIFDSLQTNPENPVFINRDELISGCKSVRSGHHIIFFRIKKKDIQIIRILHERMDFSGHFQSEEE